MPQDHQASAAVDADKAADATTAPAAQPVPLPDPFQFAVLLEQLAQQKQQP